MADNEKRLSSSEAQEIPLETLPPTQLPIAGDSASEYDEVSCTALRYFASFINIPRLYHGSIRLTHRPTVLLLRSG
jgi:hypothetical protein